MDAEDLAYETLKQEWSDQYVEVNSDRPELKRFAGQVGRVVTVNCNLKAVIDFADGGWYDITASSDYLRKLDPATAKGKHNAEANSANRFRRNKDSPTRKQGFGISMILLIDNYDSFTYNVVQRLGELEPVIDVRVFRNDQITADQVAELKPTHLIISPGPCTPREAGVSNEVLRRFSAAIPTLGVCLGHQCIGHVFGGEVIRNFRIMHGKTSPIHHDGQGIFAGLSNPFEATRYHSLVIRRETFQNPDFVVCAWTEEGEIMGVRHRSWPLCGVQFHPESFLTLEGPKLLKNFLEMGRD